MEVMEQDYFMKKLTRVVYYKIMVFVQLHETEGLHIISDVP